MVRPTMAAAFCSLWIACGPSGGISGQVAPTEAAQVGEPADNNEAPSDEGEDPNCAEATLSSIRENIFLPHCATELCHSVANPKEGLDLSLPNAELAVRLTEASHQSPSGMPLVTKLEPGSSYLFLKVLLDGPLVGQRMPPVYRLDDCDIDTLRTWIELGAP